MADSLRGEPKPELEDQLKRTWGQATGAWAWLRATNNNPIGMRYLATGFVFFLVGGLMALLMRVQLARPGNDFLTPERYNEMFTMHGSTMMFLFVVPILEGFSTLIMPSLLGSRDLPFPRLTAFGYWAYLFGGVLMYSSLLFDLVPDVGWFAYVPLSNDFFSPTISVDFWLLGLELAEAAGIISAFELIISILTMRAPNMSLGQIPVFAWAMLVVSLMIVFGFTPVLIGSLYLELDRKLGTRFFDVAAGGDPLLWQHMFWFFGHPEVYIQFLPAAGIVSTLVPVFARRQLFSYTAVVLSVIATGFLSFGLWAHHMFATGMPDVIAGLFSAASVVIAVPTGVQFFVWIATLWRGEVVWKTPMLFVAGFMVNFLVGGLTGVMVASAPFNHQVHDSYFVVAHLHYVLIGGVVFPLFAAMYYWLPKITGRMMSERLGRWNFWLMFAGFNLAFFPMHWSGFWGMPRRVYTYPAGLGLELPNLLSTAGALLFALGVLVFPYAYLRSRMRGVEADANPWDAPSLEWSVASPAPAYGFRVLPIVRSRYPLWEQDDLARGDERTERVVKALANWPVDWQATIVTSVVRGRMLEVFRLPGPSAAPVTTAFGLAIVMGALLDDRFWIAALGGLVALVGYAWWNWPERNEQRDREAEAFFREHGVRVYLDSSPTVARWTARLSFIIAGVVFGALLYTYLYLAVAGGAWPPDGVALPPVLTSGLATGLLLLGAGPLLLTLRHRRELRRGRVLAGLGGSFLFGLSALALQLYGYTRLDFAPQDHAYGSIFYLLAAFQLFMLLVALVMSTSTQFRLAFVAREDLVRPSVDNAVLAYGVVAAMWLVVALVLLLGPRVG